MASTSAVVYFLILLSMGNLPSFTGVSVYQDKDSCTTAITTMTSALPADNTGSKLACISSTDLENFAKAAGL